MEEKLLRNNLALIKSVKERAGVNIILAFKAFALWKSFPIVREYIPYSTASSKFEAQLAFEEMGSPAHTYSPAYTEMDFPTILKYSRRDMEYQPVSNDNYEELVSRMDDYIAEFEAHGTDNILISDMDQP